MKLPNKRRMRMRVAIPPRWLIRLRGRRLERRIFELPLREGLHAFAATVTHEVGRMARGVQSLPW